MKTNSPIKILLVDDLPENLFALELILSDQKYFCVKANSGNEALKILLHEQDFAIILMDVQMPEMDGFETVQLIREIEALKQVPVIFLTASMDNVLHIFKGYQSSAVDYMIKPLIPEILKAKVAVFADLYIKTHELGIAIKELVFQNEEKEKRAAELGVANKELAFQNKEKEKRAAELGIANKELLFQNQEKEKRAAELGIANKELIFQNEEKEKRAAELIIANKELLTFNYISSHDLQEPLRKIQVFARIILENENNNLSDSGKYNFQRMQLIAARMQMLINDLLAFSQIATCELKFEKTELRIIIEGVKAELKDVIDEKNATFETAELSAANIIPLQFHQLMYNLIDNSLKFSSSERPPHITISSRIVKGNTLNIEKLSVEKNYCHITIKDNGMGFESHFSERIFRVFQQLHNKDAYAGTGIGLAIVKKIVENHSGIITASSELTKGALFEIYIPAN